MNILLLKKRAVTFISVVLVLTIVFHLLVITGIIPYAIVWGGRLKTQEEMYRFESVSILLNLFFLAVILIKTNVFKMPAFTKFVNVILWFMALLFLVNTFGNLFSVSLLERIIFTPVTLLLSVASAVLALKTEQGH